MSLLRSSHQKVLLVIEANQTKRNKRNFPNKKRRKISNSLERLHLMRLNSKKLMDSLKLSQERRRSRMRGGSLKGKEDKGDLEGRSSRRERILVLIGRDQLLQRDNSNSSSK